MTYPPSHSLVHMFFHQYHWICSGLPPLLTILEGSCYFPGLARASFVQDSHVSYWCSLQCGKTWVYPIDIVSFVYLFLQYVSTSTMHITDPVTGGFRSETKLESIHLSTWVSFISFFFIYKCIDLFRFLVYVSTCPTCNTDPAGGSLQVHSILLLLTMTADDDREMEERLVIVMHSATLF